MIKPVGSDVELMIKLADSDVELVIGLLSKEILIALELIVIIPNNLGTREVQIHYYILIVILSTNNLYKNRLIVC